MGMFDESKGFGVPEGAFSIFAKPTEQVVQDMLSSIAPGSDIYNLIVNQSTIQELDREIPQLIKDESYTLTLAESGYHLYHTSGTAHTYTIPANSSAAFPTGTVITFVNGNGAGVLSIAITTDTLRLVGTSSTGTRTIAANGMATALKVASTLWYINGTGLT